MKKVLLSIFFVFGFAILHSQPEDDLFKALEQNDIIKANDIVVQHAINPNYTTRFGHNKNAYWKAAKRGYLSIIKGIATKSKVFIKPALQKDTEEGLSPLMLACSLYPCNPDLIYTLIYPYGGQNSIEQMLEEQKYGDYNDADLKGLTAFCHACLNQDEKTGFTFLKAVTLRPHLFNISTKLFDFYHELEEMKLTEKLLKKDPYALEQEEIAQDHLRYIINYHNPNNNNYSPLCYAIARGHFKLAKAMLPYCTTNTLLGLANFDNAEELLKNQAITKKNKAQTEFFHELQYILNRFGLKAAFRKTIDHKKENIDIKKAIAGTKASKFDSSRFTNFKEEDFVTAE